MSSATVLINNTPRSYFDSKPVSSTTSAARLLWRGGLQLPDGIVLDGIAFISHLHLPTPGRSLLVGQHTRDSPGTTTMAGASPAFARVLANPFGRGVDKLPGVRGDSKVWLGGEQGEISLGEGKPKRAVLFSSDVVGGAMGDTRSAEDHAGSLSSSSAVPLRDWHSHLPPTSPFSLPTSIDVEISLGLESLRGRPTVQYRGLVHIGRPALADGKDPGAQGEQEVERVDGKVQGEEGVRLYTDPACPLLLSFLHRQLTYPSGPVREKRAEEVVDLDGRTTRGILVGLGDESVDSATLILYGLVSQDSSSLPSPSTSSTQTLTLHIGKYTPNPPPIPFSTSFTETNTSSSTAAASATSSRPPRPDDPLPRQPPASGKDWFKELAGGGGSAREKKRRREESTSAGRGEKKRRDEREKEEEERNVFGSRGGGDSRGSDEARMKENRPYAEGGEGSHPSSEQGGGGSRRPSITINNETDPSATNIVESPSELPDTSAATTITSAPAPPFSTRKKPPVPKPNQLEAENKAALKTTIMQCLRERGVTKTHEEFKDLYSWVLRGSLIAFRGDLGTKVLGLMAMMKVIEGHLDLYLLPAAS